MYIKAAIALRKGTVKLGQVKINRNSIYNLFSWLIVNKLNLSLYFSGTIKIRLENHNILIS